jgi:hypothetical protein
METVNRLRKISLSLAIIGFVSTIFLSGQALSLAILEHVRDGQNKRDGISLFAGGNDPYEDAVYRYMIIAACFLFIIGIIWMRDNIYMKVGGFIPFVLLILQSWILLAAKPANLPLAVIEYSRYLEVIWYFDFFMSVVIVSLTVSYVYLLWMIYWSPVRSCP